MRVYLSRSHKFLEDYDRRIFNEYNCHPKLSYAEHLKNIREWYSYDVEVDEHGTEAWVDMTEESYTMFLIKYGNENSLGT